MSESKTYTDTVDACSDAVLTNMFSIRVITLHVCR